jgi:hypothetical protein
MGMTSLVLCFSCAAADFIILERAVFFLAPVFAAAL